MPPHVKNVLRDSEFWGEWEKHKPRRSLDLGLNPSSGTFQPHLGQVTFPVECKLHEGGTCISFVYCFICNI